MNLISILSHSCGFGYLDALGDEDVEDIDECMDMEVCHAVDVGSYVFVLEACTKNSDSQKFARIFFESQISHGASAVFQNIELEREEVFSSFSSFLIYRKKENESIKRKRAGDLEAFNFGSYQLLFNEMKIKNNDERNSDFSGAIESFGIAHFDRTEHFVLTKTEFEKTDCNLYPKTIDSELCLFVRVQEDILSRNKNYFLLGSLLMSLPITKGEESLNLWNNSLPDIKVVGIVSSKLHVSVDKIVYGFINVEELVSFEHQLVESANQSILGETKILGENGLSILAVSLSFTVTISLLFLLIYAVYSTLEHMISPNVDDQNSTCYSLSHEDSLSKESAADEEECGSDSGEEDVLGELNEISSPKSTGYGITRNLSLASIGSLFTRRIQGIKATQNI